MSRPPMPTTGSVDDWLAYVGKPYRLSRWTLMEAVEQVGPDEAPRLLAAVGREWGYQHVKPHLLGVWSKCTPMLAMSASEWLALFSGTGYLGPEGKRPIEPITLYRGASDAGRFGFSWTPNLATAKGFAVRAVLHPGNNWGRVWTASVEPERVLGYFGAPSFIGAPWCDEYVIDTRGLEVGLYADLTKRERLGAAL